MDNMTLYEAARPVPDEAQKRIQAGRLKGMTDINPMWRIKRLTEMFGPCGIGWWYVITDKRIVDDDITEQRAAFVDIDLYFKSGSEVSQPVPGTGGASFVAQEKAGPYLSDECFKMALTDAISVAAKALGVGADIYYAADRDKYTDKAELKPEPKPAMPTIIRCDNCGEEIEPYTDANGKTVGVKRWAESSKEAFGRVLCPACVEREKAIAMLKQHEEVTIAD